MHITQDLYGVLFLISFFTLTGGSVFIAVIWVTLTLLTPKRLLDTYFKEPHFNSFELAFMSSLPHSAYRTAIFGWVTLLPRLDKNRKIKDCYKVMPAWYLISLKAFMITGMIVFIIGYGIMFFLLSVDIIK